MLYILTSFWVLRTSNTRRKMFVQLFAHKKAEKGRKTKKNWDLIVPNKEKSASFLLYLNPYYNPETLNCAVDLKLLLKYFKIQKNFDLKLLEGVPTSESSVKLSQKCPFHGRIGNFFHWYIFRNRYKVVSSMKMLWKVHPKKYNPVANCLRLKTGGHRYANSRV